MWSYLNLIGQLHLPFDIIHRNVCRSKTKLFLRIWRGQLMCGGDKRPKHGTVLGMRIQVFFFDYRLFIPQKLPLILTQVLCGLCWQPILMATYTNKTLNMYTGFCKCQTNIIHWKKYIQLRNYIYIYTFYICNFDL